MKFGLEQEFFIKNKTSGLCLVPDGIPFDECGWLVEARGKPENNIISAVFSLHEDVYRIRRKLERLYPDKYYLSTYPVEKITRDLKLHASRTFSKGLTSYENYLGYKRHKNKINEAVAGIHISFTNQTVIKDKKDTNPRYFNVMFDYIKIFRSLDKAFSEEIRAFKRVPGMYELKSDGRIEYRSLPGNVDLDKLIEIIENMKL